MPGHTINALNIKKTAGALVVFIIFMAKFVRQSDPVLVSVQVAVSILMGWLFYELASGWEKRPKESPLTKLAHIFLHEKRWMFWALFLVSMGMFLLWLIGQWPGYMTPDSFSTWLQVKTLTFGNLHPIIYSLCVLALMQFFQSPAVVAVFQILITAVLGSYIFYFSLKKKVPPAAVLVFFIAFICSIPVHIYNITLWKDIPFSILVVFWAFYLFYLGLNKSTDEPKSFSTKKIVILSFLLALTCTIRHNGIIYIFFIPVIMYFMKLMPGKKWMQFFSITVVMVICISQIESRLDKGDPAATKRFFKLSWELNPIAAILSHEGYCSENKEEDKRIIEKLIPLKELKEKYNPRSAMSLCSEVYLPVSQENEDKRLKIYYTFSTLKKFLPEADLKKIDMLYYKLILSNLPIFLADRAVVFFSALGPNALMLHGNSLEDMREIEAFYENPEIHQVAYAPKSIQLEKIIKKIIAKAYVYNGFSGGRFIVWNAYIAFLLLAAALILYKWIPLSSLYSFIVMIQVPFLFAAMPESDFRYIYFIYLAGFFIIPLMITEIINKWVSNERI